MVPEAKAIERVQPTKVAPKKSDEQMPENSNEERKGLKVDRPKLSVVGRQHSIHEDASSDLSSPINDPVSNATPKVTVRSAQNRTFIITKQSIVLLECKRSSLP